MKKIFSIFAALTLSVGLWAETVSYRYPVYNEGGATKGIASWLTSSKDATPVTSTSSTWGAAGSETWLVVNGNVTISQRVTCKGDVRLILADGAKLTAQQGITVSGESNSLTIYAQSTGTQMGKLIADATSVRDAAGIGGGSWQSGSNITINGGIVEATGGENAAGIGGGDDNPGHNITINGGIVTATGDTGGAAIGGGYGGVGSNITINGGKVTATASGYHTTAIGSGKSQNSQLPDPTASNIFVATTLQVKADGNNPPTTVIENTGSDLASSLLHKFYVTIEPKPLPVSTTYLDENGVEQNISAWEVKDASATVTWGAAGDTTWFVVKGEDVQLSAGAICAGDVRLILADNAKLTVTEVSESYTPGIKVSGEGNSLTIYAQSIGEQMGQLFATGDIAAAGIGGGNWEDGSNITINGGNVTATGGAYGAGIGGGNEGNGSNITINGGIVTATGVYAAGIGGGDDGGSGFDIYISDAYVLKAGGYAEDTEVIAHSSAQDLGSTLTQNYVKIEGLAMPYTRTTSVDQWATVCLPYAATSFSGADFYKVNYYDGVDKLYIEPEDNLLAGVPYIFHTTADVVTIEHNATAPEAVTAGYEGRGLYGSFARKTIAYDAEYAFAALANNTVNVIEEGHTVTVPACRAYFDMDDVPDFEQPHSAPLRCISIPSKNPTDLGQSAITNHKSAMKVVKNGQFVIIKDNKMYNAQGVEIQ